MAACPDLNTHTHTHAQKHTNTHKSSAVTIIDIHVVSSIFNGRSFYIESSYMKLQSDLRHSHCMMGMRENKSKLSSNFNGNLLNVDIVAGYTWLVSLKVSKSLPQNSLVLHNQIIIHPQSFTYFPNKHTHSKHKAHSTITQNNRDVTHTQSYQK